MNSKQTLDKNKNPADQRQNSDVVSDTIDSMHFPVVQQQAVNLNELLDVSCRKYSDVNALGMATEKPLTYGQLYDRVLVLAALLRSCGVEYGDRVAILAENSHNWGTIYLAIVRLGAICVPILPDLPEADVHHILDEMECDIIFLTRHQLEKIYDVTSLFSRVITLDDCKDDSGIVEVATYSAFLAEARAEYAKELEAGTLEFPEIDASHLASILYTSGTSGFSKAVMLSHANLCANAFAASVIITLPPGAVFLSVLPISHAYEFTVGFIMPLIKGCCILYAGKTPTPMVLQKLCAHERPHVMLTVPLIMEKIYKKRVMPTVDQSTMLTLLCRFEIGRKLVYRKIGRKLLDFFGGRLEVMGIGGGALNLEVEAFLRSAGFPYLVGYGLTESAPLISGGPTADQSIALGSAGKPVPGVEVCIDDPNPQTGIGEILARGPNIMQGYWNDPEASNETLTDEGWLKTGDLGFVDELGNLHVKGRLKLVIVLSNGENVYPEAIEHKLNMYPVVVESLVIENRSLLEAWIYPDYEFVDAQTHGQSRQQRHAYIAAELDRIRHEVNVQLSSMARLSRILERRESFIKTATHKIKRYLYSADSLCR